MAFTVTRDKSVFGNKATVGLKIIADAATQAIDSGLSRIDYFVTGEASMATANIKVGVNKGASGTSVAGLLALTGCASGDEMYIVVYGIR